MSPDTTTLRTPAPTFSIHRYPSALIDRVALADGRSVTVRPVLPQDSDAEQSLFSAMSPQSRRLRFHGAVNQLPAPVLAGLTQIDYRRQLALVAESVCADGDTRLVADARYVVDDGSDDSAEFAIAIADDWQRLGLGHLLMQRLSSQACRQGIVRLRGSVLAGNVAMLGLLQRLGAAIRGDRHDGSIVHATIQP